jgi:hypothetical protein
LDYLLCRVQCRALGEYGTLNRAMKGVADIRRLNEIVENYVGNNLYLYLCSIYSYTIS